MRLLELLNVLSTEKKQGLIHIDDWKWSDVDYLKTMGFEFEGEYKMSLKSPEISIFKKKISSGEIFVIEEKNKPVKYFRNFEHVIQYFDTYSQPEIDNQRR